MDEIGIFWAHLCRSDACGVATLFVVDWGLQEKNKNNEIKMIKFISQCAVTLYGLTLWERSS